MASDETQYRVTAANAAQAAYRVETLPLRGDLYIKGVKATKGAKFTQEDLNKDQLEYRHTAVETAAPIATDSFTFSVLVGDKTVTAKQPLRVNCLPKPEIAIPSDGIYVFPISIKVAYTPERKNEGPLEVMAGEKKCADGNVFSYTIPQDSKTRITYTVTEVAASEKFGKWSIHGANMVVGSVFTQGDIDNGMLCFTANSDVEGAAPFSFNVCNRTIKCKSGRFEAKVKDWPYPVVVQDTVSVQECEGVTLTESNLLSTVAFGSTAEQITYTVTKVGKFTITPMTFTQADVKAGRVRLNYPCVEGPLESLDYFEFNVCTQKRKCTAGKGKVKVAAKPIPVTPEPPSVVFEPDYGCQYEFDATNQSWTPTSPCGVWTVVTSREVPLPLKQVGNVIHFPYTQQGPLTVVVKPDGQLMPVPNRTIDYPPKPTPYEPNKGPEVAPTTQPTKGQKYTAPDGTVWMGTADGQWKPIKGTVPRTGLNQDPIVKAGPYLLQVPSFAEVPKGVNEIYHTGLRAPFIYNNTYRDWTSTATYDVPEFVWRGPNEFYVAPGSFFTLNFFTSRYYTRIDIMGGSGVVMNRLDPQITDHLGGSANTGGVGIYNIVGDGIADSYRADPRQMMSYGVKLPGNRLAAFNSTIRPIGGPNYSVKDWYTEGVSWSYDGIYSGQMQRGFRSVDYSQGPYDPQLHFEGWRRNNPKTGKPMMGWRNAALILLDFKWFKQRSQAINGGPWETRGPSAGESYVFVARATDIVTGQQIMRNFVIHHSASASGRAAETTDNMGLPSMNQSPQRQKAYCSLINGKPQNCFIA